MEFSISKMAQLHGITRQTLIYYDKIGLLHPARVDDRGCRFYSSDQMPFLREICFLKNMNIPLKMVEESIKGRNTDTVIRLLQNQIEQLETQQMELERMKKTLQGRLSLYQRADGNENVREKIYVEHIPKRRALLIKWPDREMDATLLHMCYVEADECLKNMDLSGIGEFGALLRRESLKAEDPLKEAGSLFFLPPDAPETEGEIEIPEGDYVCMLSCGMPYRLAAAYQLWSACREQKLKTEGDLINVCLLDGTFHSDKMKEDLCQLQLKIRESTEKFQENIE